MTFHDDRVFIALIRDSARGAMRTVARTTREEFLAGETRQEAAAFNILLISERVPKLSSAYKAAHPDVDWDELAALRAKTEPEFAQIDAEAEWNAATTLLPKVADALDALLPADAPWNGTAPKDAGPPNAEPSGTRERAQPAPAPLPIARAELDALCRRLRVTRLQLFGSAVRTDFGPDSDIDLLVEYEPGTNHPWGGAGLHEEFSPLFDGRVVDLIDTDCISPYVRDGVLAEAVEIYPVDRRPTEKVKR
jgi:predicted nucleotidyltransferase/uncharacterized protein with HEPN domain